MAYTDYDQSQIVAQIQAAFQLYREVDPTFLEGIDFSSIDGDAGGPNSRTNTSIDAWIAAFSADGKINDISRDDPRFLEELYHGIRSQLTTDARITAKLNEWADSPDDLNAAQRAMLRAGNALHGDTTLVLINDEAAERAETARVAATLNLEENAFSVAGMAPDAALNDFQAEAAAYSLAFLRAEGLYSEELQAQINGEVDTAAEFAVIQAALRSQEAVDAMRARAQAIINDPTNATANDIFLIQSAVAMYDPTREMVIDGDLGADGFTAQQLDAGGTSETIIRLREFLEGATTTVVLDPPVIERDPEPVVIERERDPEPVVTLSMEVVNVIGRDPVVDRYIRDFAGNVPVGAYNISLTNAEQLALADHTDGVITQADIYDAFVAYRQVNITPDLAVSYFQQELPGVLSRRADEWQERLEELQTSPDEDMTAEEVASEIAALQARIGMTPESVDTILRGFIQENVDAGMSQEDAVIRGLQRFESETMGFTQNQNYIIEDYLRSHGMVLERPDLALTTEQAEALAARHHSFNATDIQRTSNILDFYTQTDDARALGLRDIVSGTMDVERALRDEGLSIEPRTRVIVRRPEPVVVAPAVTLARDPEPVISEPVITEVTLDPNDPFGLNIPGAEPISIGDQAVNLRAMLNATDPDGSISLNEAVQFLQHRRLDLDMATYEITAEDTARLSALRTELGLGADEEININDPRLYSALAAFANNTTVAESPPAWNTAFAAMTPIEITPPTPRVTIAENNPFGLNINGVEPDAIGVQANGLRAMLNVTDPDGSISLNEAVQLLQHQRLDLDMATYEITEEDTAKLNAIRTELGLGADEEININDPRLYSALAAFANNTTVAESPAAWNAAFTAMAPIVITPPAPDVTLEINTAAAEVVIQPNNPFGMNRADEEVRSIGDQAEQIRNVLGMTDFNDNGTTSIEDAVTAMRTLINVQNDLDMDAAYSLTDADRERIAAIRTELGMNETDELSLSDPRLYSALAAYANNTTIAESPAAWQTAFEAMTPLVVEPAIAENNPFGLNIDGVEPDTIGVQANGLRAMLNVTDPDGSISLNDAVQLLQHQRLNLDMATYEITTEDTARLSAIRTELGLGADEEININDPRLYSALAAFANNTTVAESPAAWNAAFTAMTPIEITPPAPEITVSVAENNPFGLNIDGVEPDAIGVQATGLRAMINLTDPNRDGSIALNDAIILLQNQRLGLDVENYEITAEDTARLNAIRTELGIEPDAEININDPRLFSALAAFANDITIAQSPEAWQAAFAAMTPLEIARPEPISLTEEHVVVATAGTVTTTTYDSDDLERAIEGIRSNLSAEDLARLEDLESQLSNVEMAIRHAHVSLLGNLPEGMNNLGIEELHQLLSTDSDEYARAMAHPAIAEHAGLQTIFENFMRYGTSLTEARTDLDALRQELLEGAVMAQPVIQPVEPLPVIEAEVLTGGAGSETLVSADDRLTGATDADLLTTDTDPRSPGEIINDAQVILQNAYLPDDEIGQAARAEIEPEFGISRTIQSVMELTDILDDPADGAPVALDETYGWILDAQDYLSKLDADADPNIATRLAELSVIKEEIEAYAEANDITLSYGAEELETAALTVDKDNDLALNTTVQTPTFT